MFRLIYIPAYLALIMLVTGCGSDEPDFIRINLAHGLSTTHPVHDGMSYFADEVEKLSEGKIQVVLYHSEQLGSERELVELVQAGSIQMTKASTAVLEGFVPVFEVMSLPYLFRDDSHRFRVLESDVGREFLLAPEKYNMRGLIFYDAGSRSFYTRGTPIRTPGDLESLRIRVMESPTAIKMVQHMGGSPTPISWGELYSAIQQGIVDGAENNPPTFYQSNHYEIVDYFSLDEHSSIPDILLISKRFWEDLSEEQQEWIQQAADASAQYQREVWQDATEEALERVKEAGVEIIRPDKAPFQEQVSGIYDEYENQPELYSIIQRIRDME